MILNVFNLLGNMEQSKAGPATSLLRTNRPIVEQNRQSASEFPEACVVNVDKGAGEGKQRKEGVLGTWC